MATDTSPADGKVPMLPGDLGEVRTIMAADRTLMAWVRTALSMDSFGFTIYKALDALADKGQLDKTDSPRQVGMFLVFMGTSAMLLGTWNYFVTLRDLERLDKFRFGRPVLVISSIMSLAGIFLFLAITFRLI